VISSPRYAWCCINDEISSRSFLNAIPFPFPWRRPIMLSPHTRRRLYYFVGTFLVIGLGLASRRYPWLFPSILGKYPGDALWALMAFCGWIVLLPSASRVRIASVALATSFAVEFSQLYQAPWINAIRAHPLGHLVLGSGFSARDLIAYAIGVAFGVCIDWAAVKLSVSRRSR